MYLKSLTLKGFKSFASATTLRFETGITAVVGPNGSGKSNVVDAISWVLGEQGAKALRGGKMQDVIFAGTSGRAPLGRAEVTLTIDNSDNFLPIDYTEVSITRRMFRDGASEYEINGAGSRLLDIQELLSDSGIGRELHVIVGQGQLDSVLQARPEDRRGFIEEAAGVLKHRKRKERALRKIDAMQANLTRLTDLTGELRRQLKPLGRQADVARRAAGVQAELRDSRLRLLADDLVALRTAHAREAAQQQSVRAQRNELESRLDRCRAREAELAALLAQAAPALARVQQTWYELSALQERLRATAQVARERHRHLLASLEVRRAGQDPDVLGAEAVRMRERQAGSTAASTQAQAILADAISQRQHAEQVLAAAEGELVAAARAVADRREGLARLVGQVNAFRTRVTTGAEEQARLGEAALQARARGAQAQQELEAVQALVGALDEGELDLDRAHEVAVAAHERVQALVVASTQARGAADRELSTWTARRDALALGLKRKDGSAALLTAGSAATTGVLGPVAELLRIEPGCEAAVAAALGPFADAVAVAAATDAIGSISYLKTTDGGRSHLLIAASNMAAQRETWPALGQGARWVADLVAAPPTIAASVDAMLDRVALVADLDAGALLVRAHAGVRAVTVDGDVLGAGAAIGGSTSAASFLEIQVEVDEARARVSDTSKRLAQLARAHQSLLVEQAAAQDAVEVAVAALHDSDARMSAIAEQLARWAQAARSAHAEADRLDDARQSSAAARERDLETLGELQARLTAARAVHVDVEPPTDERDGAAAILVETRQLEVDARLALRSAEERVRSLAARAQSLERAAAAERAADEHERQLRSARARGAEIAAAVYQGAGRALECIAASLKTAATRRDEQHADQVVLEAELDVARAGARELATELDRLTDTVHREEVSRAEQRLRIEQVEQRAADDFGIEADALVAEYGPDELVPASAQEQAEFEQARERGDAVVAPQPGAFHRPSQEKRAGRAERDLALLGKVNPLALEEFAALEERHQFLATQLEDIKDTRRDLMSVVREVDERIVEVFTAAYHDVAREFELVFATLFPGGQGQLVLTQPEDMLATGIEVEARPPGKRVKRLSLLSGGERSLTAVALLLAIFRARPSPFYVLDEVEAALDDVNLGRLLTAIEGLRARSQLIVITHQKRTMEIADTLYGVTMRGDGVSTVISQRLRERDDVPVPASA